MEKMRSLLNRLKVTPTRSALRYALGAAVAALIISGSPTLQAQIDDFSDGNDTLNPTWTHLSGYVGSTGQAWDASTGVYRLTAPNNGVTGLGFIGSHVGAAYADVRVSADMVSFVGPPTGAVFGVAARLNGNNAMGGLSGYAYNYEPFAASGAGEMVLYRINPGISITDIGNQQVTLDPNKDYTFVLEIIGPNLHGQVFEIGGGMVAESFATDATYASGFSGLIAYSQNPVPPVDFSVDNFLAQVPEPATNPPAITMQPASTNVSPGASVTFSVTATGFPAPTYQWRLNGVNLDGETNATLTINMLQAANGGSYSVGVANVLGAVNSAEAILKLNLPPLPMTNNFADRVIVTNLARVGASSNVGATEEPPGEPKHAGKTGGTSMWITWMAPAMPGIVIFQTSGSSFDTLLAAYTGMSVGALTPVAGDDDRGGFYTSKIAFNTVPGTLYHIAVDGLAAAQGDIVLEWSFEVTTDTLPIITTQPQNQTVGLTSNATFSVMASGSSLSYQWFFNGNVISGETMPSLAVPNVQLANLGSYFVRVTNGPVRFVDSRTASLQISMVGVDNQVQDLRNADKFYDVLNPPSGQPFAGGKPKPVPQAQVTVQSYTGTQIFRASEASREAGEQQHCSVPGGASWWFYYVPLANGKLHLNTHGSTFDTVLAVYTTPGFALSNLTMVVCDNNSGTNSQTSKLSFQATNGTAYYIVIDGVNGLTGTVYLNYRLLVPMVLTNIVMTNLNVCKFLVTATPSYNFTIERSSNLVDWTSMPTTYTTTTNGTYNFSDTNALGTAHRFYRGTQTP